MLCVKGRPKATTTNVLTFISNVRHRSPHPNVVAPLGEPSAYTEFGNGHSKVTTADMIVFSVEVAAQRRPLLM